MSEIVSPRLHPIEQAYGFQDTAFKAYLEEPHPESLSTNEFLHLCESMSLCDEPFVQYAAASALLERATQHHGDASAELRKYMFEQGKELLQKSRMSNLLRCHNAQDEDEYQRRISTDLQIQGHLAHMPMFEALSYQKTGRDLQDAHDVTYGNLIALGEQLTQQHKFYRMQKNPLASSVKGQLSEVLTSAIVYRSNKDHITALPGSVHVDSHPDKARRADLVVRDTSDPEQEQATLVQIKSTMSRVARDCGRYYRVFLLYAFPHLAFDDAPNTMRTMQHLIDEYNGISPKNRYASLRFLKRWRETDKMSAGLLKHIQNYREPYPYSAT